MATKARPASIRFGPTLMSVINLSVIKMPNAQINPSVTHESPYYGSLILKGIPSNLIFHQLCLVTFEFNYIYK